MAPPDSSRELTLYPRVLVCGGTDFNDVGYVWEYLDALAPTTVIHGNRTGADRFAAQWVRDNSSFGVEEATLAPTSATWAFLGRHLIDNTHPDLVLAFYPGGPGVRDMLRHARSVGIEVWELPQRPRHEDHRSDLG
jgi:hypothetical protein